MKHAIGPLTSIALVLMLAGCGDGGPSSGMVDCVSIGHGFSQCRITMTDTRRVTCVVVNGKGIDCDWLHADGTDDL